MTYHLDAATTLSPTADGAFLYAGGEAYLNYDTAFGGWVMALAVEAVQQSDGARGDIVSLSATFVDAIKNQPLIVTADLVMRRPRTDFWRISIAYQEAPEQVVFSADLVASEPRAGEISFDHSAPSVKAPEDVPRIDGAGRPGWFQHIDTRWVVGRPFQVNERPYSVTWTKDAQSRPLDAKLLIALSDAIAPRTFFAANGMTFGSTVQFSVSLFAAPEDYAAAAGDFLMLEGDSDCIRSGVYDQRGRIWSRDGRLLAVSNQIAFYKQP